LLKKYLLVFQVLLLAAAAQAAPANHHPSRVIVKFKPGQRDFVPGSGSSKSFSGDEDLFVVNNPSRESVDQVLEKYAKNPNVVYAEPDYQVSTLETVPNDPQWAAEWDMAKIAAPAAWGVQTAATDPVVFVIDTGIYSAHPELAANVLPGWTCLGGSCVAGGQDDQGHGTHVAGTIAAIGNNNLGIAGINWQAKVMACKFLGSNGSGYLSDAISCFDKAVELKGKGVNIRVTNNSWGGGPYTQALRDAMVRANSAGILNICAAGNSGQNSDLAPMYPAAYEDRGIISVLASDSGDAGAYFTNYGLASVDIAAPGVSILSTLPTGTCQLCSPSGYGSLSGTSMAAPHVTGVVAALFQRNPGLTAYQARDILLDPASYDAVSDFRASQTSTGGRLNYFKALTNPKELSPGPLNGFPTIAAGGITANAGDAISLSPVTSDPDSDPLTLAFGRQPLGINTWLFSQAIDSQFPDASGSSISFTAPFLGRPATVDYAASVADHRGGGSSAAIPVTVMPSSVSNAAPTGTLSVSPLSGPVGTVATIQFPVSDPEGDATWADVWITGNRSASGTFIENSMTWPFNAKGVYRITAQPVDRHLNFGPRQTTVVRIGGAAGTPPVANVSLDTLSGRAPLSVRVDGSASYDPDGTISQFVIFCNYGVAGLAFSGPVTTCSYDQPGTYWVLLQAIDSAGLMDVASNYVSVSAGDSVPPPPPPDTTAPTISITSPSNGATVSGTVVIQASASDNVGVNSVAFLVDGALKCTVTAAPYSCSWDAAATPDGPHSITAVAKDAADNSGTASITGTVDNTAPTVSISSPANGSTISGTVVIQASASDNVGVKSVAFSVDGTLKCTVTVAPYSCSWNASVAPDGPHSITAVAEDAADNTGSNSVTGTVNNSCTTRGSSGKCRKR
jgi:subtilisin family serine protease